MMINAYKLARPYAQAVFEYALEHKQIEDWSAALQMLANGAEIPVLKSLLTNPQYTTEQLTDIFLQLGTDRLNEHVANLIKLLAKKRRLPILPAVQQLFEQFRATNDQTIEVSVSSAIELDESYKQTLNRVLSKKFDQRVALQYHIDESLLGGLLIRAGDKVIDSSVRGRLQRMREALI
jgi:F-type H+-transporting ATPase subunit delta